MKKKSGTLAKGKKSCFINVKEEETERAKKSPRPFPAVLNKAHYLTKRGYEKGKSLLRQKKQEEEKKEAPGGTGALRGSGFGEKKGR